MATISNSHSSSERTNDFILQEELSLSDRFSNWCLSLEPLRFMVMSFILIVQCCILAPAVVLLSSFLDKGITGPSIALAAASTMAVMVSNISLLPMKGVVITFIISLTINLSLIATHIF